MNRLTVSLLAALDAVITLAVGVAIPLVPLTVMWGVQFTLAADWLQFWRAACDIWLLGHGVDVTFTLSPELSAQVGLNGQNVFPITIAALGFALLTVLLGFRTGRRAWASGHAIVATVVGVVVFAVLSAGVTLSAHVGVAVPSLLQGSLLPAGVFALGIGLGVAWEETAARAEAAGDREQHVTLVWPFGRMSTAARATLAAGVRGGVAASALVVGAAAVVFAALLAVNYGRIVALYDGLQPGVLGAVSLTLAQLALLPNAVIWTASWLAGPGFALGAGSSVNVLHTVVGPVPSVPLLAVVPGGAPAFGLIGVLVPMLCGAVAGYLTRLRMSRTHRVAISRVSRAGSFARTGALPGTGSYGRVGDAATGKVEWTARRLVVVALITAVVSGIVIGLLAWWSAGAIGPGRLQHVGPDALVVAGAIVAEVLVGAVIGLATRRESAASAPAWRVATVPSARERRAASAAAAAMDADAVDTDEVPVSDMVVADAPVTKKPGKSAARSATPASAKGESAKTKDTAPKKPSAVATGRDAPRARASAAASLTVAELVEQSMAAASERSGGEHGDGGSGADPDQLDTDVVTFSKD